MQQRRIDRGRRTSQVASALGVDRVGRLAMGLGAIDVGPRSAVDCGLGTLALIEGEDRLLVGDVHLGKVDEHEIVARALARALHVVAEHPGGACDEHPHRIEMSELSPTMKR